MLKYSVHKLSSNRHNLLFFPRGTPFQRAFKMKTKSASFTLRSKIITTSRLQHSSTHGALSAVIFFLHDALQIIEGRVFFFFFPGQSQMVENK